MMLAIMILKPKLVLYQGVLIYYFLIGCIMNVVGSNGMGLWQSSIMLDVIYSLGIVLSLNYGNTRTSVVVIAFCTTICMLVASLFDVVGHPILFALNFITVVAIGWYVLRNRTYSLPYMITMFILLVEIMGLISYWAMTFWGPETLAVYQSPYFKVPFYSTFLIMYSMFTYYVFKTKGWIRVFR